MKPSRKWIKKAMEYRNKALSFWEETARARFESHKEPIKECPYDFSDKAALDLYIYESTGIGDLSIDIFRGTINGYVVGKKWLDVEKNRKDLDA